MYMSVAFDTVCSIVSLIHFPKVRTTETVRNSLRVFKYKWKRWAEHIAEIRNVRKNTGKFNSKSEGKSCTY